MRQGAEKPMVKSPAGQLKAVVRLLNGICPDARPLEGMMWKDNQPGIEVISKRELIIPRGHMESDRAPCKAWQTEDERLLFDAPWHERSNEEERDRGPILASLTPNLLI
jgi:hypothetical protein